MATMIKSKCGGCGSILSAPESYAGKNAKCPKCGTVVPVPQATIGGVSKAVLAAELEALAAKALSRAVSLVPPEQRTSAEALTAAPIPAPSEEEEAKETASEARPRRFRVEILISVLGVAIVAGAVYFFATKVMRQQDLDKSRDELRAMIDQADDLWDAGKLREAAPLYRKLLGLIQEHAAAFKDARYDEDATEMKNRLAVADAMEGIQKDIDKAETHRGRKEYALAKKTYEDARTKATKEHERLKHQEISRLIPQIEKALQADDIRLGSQGYVLADGKWVTPPEKKRLDERKKEEEMKAKGFVLFRGEWMKQEQKDAILAKAKADSEERAKSLEKEKEVRAAKAAAFKPQTLDPSAAVIVLDDFESDLRWAVQGWGNPAQIEIAPHGSSKALKIVYQPGPKDKNAIEKTYRADLTSRDKLLFDAFNPGEKMVQGTIAFFCTQGGNFFESSWFYVKKGENKDITVELKTPNWKSEITSWGYSAKVPLEHVRSILFLLYPKAAGEIYVDNVRLVKGK